MPDLRAEHRSKLDSIVHQMIQDGESEQNIQSVVNDFKAKYAGPAGPEQFDPNREGAPDESLLTSIAHFPVHGLEQMVHGFQNLPAGDRLMSLHDILSGGAKAAAPFILPAAAISAPIGTALGIGAGGLAGGITPSLARGMGASEGGAQLAGDLAGAGAGAVAGFGANALGSRISRGAMDPLLQTVLEHKFPMLRLLKHAGISPFGGAESIPPDLPTGGLGNQPGPYFHERTTIDPQFRGPIPPVGPIQPSGITFERGTRTPPPAILSPIGTAGEFTTPAPTGKTIPPVLGPGNIPGVEDFHTRRPIIPESGLGPVGTPDHPLATEVQLPVSLESHPRSPLGSPLSISKNPPALGAPAPERITPYNLDPVGFDPASSPGKPTAEHYKTAARTTWGKNLAAKIRAEKIDPSSVKSWTPAQWDAHATELRLGKSSPDKIARAIEFLSRGK